MLFKLVPMYLCSFNYFQRTLLDPHFAKPDLNEDTAVGLRTETHQCSIRTYFVKTQGHKGPQNCGWPFYLDGRIQNYGTRVSEIPFCFLDFLKFRLAIRGLTLPENTKLKFNLLPMRSLLIKLFVFFIWMNEHHF